MKMLKDKWIYLDNNSSSQLDPDVVSMVTEWISKPVIGNPNSMHFWGQRSLKAIEVVRDKIMRMFGIRSSNCVVFFSSVTEALNTIIRSIMYDIRGLDLNVLGLVTDHSSITHALQYWGREYDVDVKLLSVDKSYSISTEEFKKEGSKAAYLVCSLVNSETGNILDINHISNLCAEHKVKIILDITSGIGKMPIVCNDVISAWCFSGHKIHGLQGVGVGVLSLDTINLIPLIHGGEQEFGLRSGTSNVLSIISLGICLDKIQKNLHKDILYMSNLRCQFEECIAGIFPDSCINGVDGNRICNISNIYLGNDIDSNMLLIYLDQKNIAVSIRTACNMLNMSSSLVHMGYSARHAHSSLRFSFSRYNNKEDIECVCTALSNITP